MMEPQWIDEGEQLKRFCEKMGDGPVAVDTESDHFHAYQARVCLIQLAEGDHEALIDPLALDRDDLGPLFEILEDPSVVKILHAARNDILEIDRDYQVTINNLFDTQIAARFLDLERNSLQWMLEELVGVETGSQFKRFDWTTRPVPAKAKRYAVDDVRYLDQLRTRFTRRLEEEQWMEPFTQQCNFVTRSVEYEANEFDPGDWRGLKNTDKLDGRGRAALKKLFQWRHELCTELNRSAVTTFPNGVLLKLANKRPPTAAGVSDISGIPGQLANNYADDIAGVIEESRQADAPPKHPPRTRHEPPPPEQKARYHSLRKWRNQKADDLDIPTEFIATNDTVSKIAADPPANIDDLLEFRAILPWHGKKMGEEMIEVLNQAGS